MMTGARWFVNICSLSVSVSPECRHRYAFNAASTAKDAGVNKLVSTGILPSLLGIGH